MNDDRRSTRESEGRSHSRIVRHARMMSGPSGRGNAASAVAFGSRSQAAGGDGSAACPVKAIESLGRFGSSASVKRIQRTRGVEAVQYESQSTRGSQEPSSLTQMRFVTLTMWGLTAGGSGTASREAITINAPSNQIVHETTFIPAGAPGGNDNVFPPGRLWNLTAVPLARTLSAR
jgi:hypothetical protein